LLVWYLPPDKDFLAENPYWNGTRQLAAQPVRSLGELARLPDKSALILLPYLPMGSQELSQLRDFVSGGGILVLADDYGYGNQVLEYLGLKARFYGQTLLDPLFNFKNQNFPRVTRFNSPVTTGLDSLVLNYATALENVADEETLALSSVVSFLDRNENATWDTGEPTGPLPVVSRHKLGGGQVFLVSDPSIFINSMLDLGSNRTFVSRIAAGASGLFLDQSHLPPSQLIRARGWLTPLVDFLTTPGGVAIMSLALLVLILVPLWQERRPFWQ
ncbi:MAG: DUF4350 domain-containing protein, partial [Chloroflexota bacterium]